MQTLNTIVVWMATLSGLAFFFIGVSMWDTIRYGAVYGISIGLILMLFALILRVMSGDKREEG